MALNTHIGVQIRKARRMVGLTQKELGEKINKSGATIAYLEQGKRRVSPDVLQEISQITGHHLSFFYEEKENVDSQLIERFDHLKIQLEEMAHQLGSDAGKEGDFGLAFDQAADAMILVDMKGKVLAVNKKHEELMGWSREELVGKAFYRFSFFSLKKMPRLVKLFRQVIKSGKIVDAVQMPLKNASGDAVEVEIRSSLLKKSNKTWAMMCVTRPIKSPVQVIDDLL
jgi:PAS domain S-box-containing protein